MLVRFAGCCDPVAGDDVIGFVTRGRGVTVHTRDCARIFALDPERRIDVQWDDEAVAARPIKVRVISVDQPGILAKVTKSISAGGINIGAATITTGEGATAIQSFELWVPDLTSLDQRDEADPAGQGCALGGACPRIAAQCPRMTAQCPRMAAKELGCPSARV